MALNFELKKNGFPIKIGDIEFFFETSTEKLREFFVRQEKYELEFEELKAALMQVESISDFDEKNPEEALKLKTEVEKAINLTKKMAALEYDALLGEGSFDKIYATFTDVDKLREVFYDIEAAVAEAIINDSEKRTDTFNKKRAELLKKRAAKRKKAKK